MNDNDSFRLIPREWISLWLAIVAAFAFLFFPLRAQADLGKLSLDLAIGEGRYHQPPDGMFFQKDQDHSNRYKDTAYEVGLAWKPVEWLELSGHFVNLGRVRMNANATTCPGDDCTKRDNALDPQRAECNAKFSDQACRYNWLSGGGIKGLEGFVSARVWQEGRFSFWPGVGALLYQAKYTANVYPLIGCTDAGCPWRETIEQRTRAYLSPVVGFSVRYTLTENATVVLSWKDTLRTVQHVPISAGFSKDHQRMMLGLQMAF